MEHSILAGIFTALGIAVLHWFPWRLALRRPLPNLAAYVLGTLAIALPATWAIENGVPPIPALWGCIFYGGASAAMAYFIDWLIHLTHKVEDLAEKANGLD